MSAPTQTRPRRSEPQDRRIRRSWWVLAGAFLLLCLVLLVRAVATGTETIDLVVATLVGIVGVAAVRHRDAVRGLEAGRRAEAESFARILQGLSRSISPGAIVRAIAEELAVGTAADHVVVVHRDDGGRALLATLVSSRPGVPSSTTLLPASDLDDPVDLEVAAPAAIAVGPGLGVAVGAAVRADESAGDVATATALAGRWSGRARSLGRSIVARIEGVDGLDDVVIEGEAESGARNPGSAVAERIAARVRDVYGLRNTLAAPLRTDEGLAGAIVVSRRTTRAWPASARRILQAAAVEASAALSRARSHRAAETLASTDALTGLPNRRYFDEFCGLLARRRRAEDAVGVLMIDIDRFKSLNDSHGHAVGDEVLRMVGRAIATAVREDDVPARYGGEEFAVLLRNPGPGIAAEVGERVRAAVAALDVRRFGVPSVSVSVGVAVAAAPDEPVPDLVARADRALYRAKRAGRDRVVAA